MNVNEITYWVTLASMPKMWTRRKNQLFIACYQHIPRYSIIDLLERPNVRRELGVTLDEELLFVTAHEQLARNAFMVEDILNQGYDILPITSPDYPQALKKNLKQGAPCVIYVKGNKSLLNHESTAIVGSRKADNISLEFANNMAKKATRESKTVVSGFAKGVDRQALDATLEVNGTSIIVLPQGITTFSSGFRQYYQPISQGKVAVVSIFHPKATWSVELAMARNSIIYAMASDIYVAQSESKGGTWSGVTEGLKKGQKIHVRIPQCNEKNANMLLIQMGGIGVDFNGNVVTGFLQNSDDNSGNFIYATPNGSRSVNGYEADVKSQILNLLVGRKTSKDILVELGIDWSDAKMKKFLRSMLEIEEEKVSGRILFFKKGSMSPTLFDD